MAESLKEFLVSVSWASDPASQKKFTDALEGATLRANILANAIEKMASVVIDQVSQTAKSLESMHYLTERTKSSSENIKALEFAFQQTGRQAGDSTKLLESFNAQLDRNKGYRDQIETGLHVPLRGVNGTLKDNVTLMRDVGIAIAKMTDPQQRAIYSDMFKFDPQKDFNTFGSPKFMPAFGEEISRLQAVGLAGVDAQKAEEAAAHYGATWRDIWTNIADQAEGVTAKVIGFIEPATKALDDWLNVHRALIKEAQDYVHTPLGQSPSEKGFGAMGGDQSLGTLGPKFIRMLFGAPGSSGVTGLINDLLGISGAHAGTPLSAAQKASSAILLNGVPVSSGNHLPVYDPRTGTAQAVSAFGGLTGMSPGLGSGPGGFDLGGVKSQSLSLTVGKGMSMYPGISNAQLAQEIRSTFARAGDDPEIAVRMAQAEGAFAHSYFGDNGTSGGAFQGHRTGPHGSSVGDQMFRDGVDPFDPNTRLAQLKWVAKYVHTHGWPKDWTLSAGKVGVSGMMGAGGGPYADPGMPSGGTFGMDAFGGLGSSSSGSSVDDHSVTHGGHTVNSPVSINIDGAGGDAHTLAQMVGSSVRRANQDIVSNLRGSFA